MTLNYNSYLLPIVGPLDSGAADPATPAPPQSAGSGIQTPAAPQQVSTAQTAPAGQSVLLAHAVKPKQGVVASEHAPPPSAVVTQMGLGQSPGPHEAVKYPQVEPAHSGLGPMLGHTSGPLSAPQHSSP